MLNQRVSTPQNPCIDYCIIFAFARLQTSYLLPPSVQKCLALGRNSNKLSGYIRGMSDYAK